MPSGAKKRKAAKKKKEQAAHTINSSTNKDPHGNGDPRSQDERESDGGSPASQGDQHPFSQSNVTEEKSAEFTNLSGSDDVVAVKIEKELGPKEDHESTLVTVQHVEHDKSSSSSSSSRSSSDDESRASEKKLKEEDYDFGSQVTTGGNVDKNVDNNSCAETANVDNLVEPMLSVPEEVGHDIEISKNKSVPDVVEPGLKKSEGKTSSASTTSTAESSSLVEKTQHFDPHDFSENQPLVASTPPVVQRTSVFSCCGLFDVFSGSGR